MQDISIALLPAYAFVDLLASSEQSKATVAVKNLKIWPEQFLFFGGPSNTFLDKFHTKDELFWHSSRILSWCKLCMEASFYPALPVLSSHPARQWYLSNTCLTLQSGFIIISAASFIPSSCHSNRDISVRFPGSTLVTYKVLFPPCTPLIANFPDFTFKSMHLHLIKIISAILDSIYREKEWFPIWKVAMQRPKGG